MDPNFLFVASHGKRSAPDDDALEEDDDTYLRAQRYFINRPNSMIFYKPSGPELGKRSGDLFYLPRPNNFLSPMKGKRFRSPNSFNFPLLSAQEWLMANEMNSNLAEDDSAAQADYITDPAVFDVKFGKRKDDAAFETFLGSRGR